MNNTIASAVAKRDAEPNTPAKLIKQYSSDLATVLPSHINGATWVRVAQGALKKGNRNKDGATDLEVAAMNNPASFMAALLDAARQGLEPGTDQYYLTPRKVKGRMEILGITGYQGYIELMFRSGAVASIVGDVVKTGDQFSYQRGRDDVPNHVVDWFGADRGQLIGTYAYARMKGGAVSQVIVLGARDIDRIKSKSASAGSDYSPWATNPEAMWLKSAFRQLRKFVPTTPEWMTELLRSRAESQTVAAKIGDDVAEALAGNESDDIIDGEYVDETETVSAASTEWPEVVKPGTAARVADR